MAGTGMPTCMHAEFDCRRAHGMAANNTQQCSTPALVSHSSVQPAKAARVEQADLEGVLQVLGIVGG